MILLYTEGNQSSNPRRGEAADTQADAAAVETEAAKQQQQQRQLSSSIRDRDS